MKKASKAVSSYLLHSVGVLFCLDLLANLGLSICKGRTHRSNQVNAPEYVFLISDLAGERRFASIVAKRLESLGALTHGDRRAGESRDLSRFNIDNRYGNEALQTMMSDLMEVETSPLIPPPKDWEGDFFAGQPLFLRRLHLGGLLYGQPCSVEASVDTLVLRKKSEFCSMPFLCSVCMYVCTSVKN